MRGKNSERIGLCLCIMAVLCLVAGCVALPGSKSPGSNQGVNTQQNGAGSNTGQTGGGGSGGSGGGAVSPSSERTAGFLLKCKATTVQETTDATDTTTIKLEGDIPFTMSRDWDKKPAIDGMQIYPMTEQDSELPYYVEFTQKCKSTNCIPCHFIYNGPLRFMAAIQHQPEDADQDWTARIGPSTNTLNAMTGGTLTQYVENKLPECPVTTELETGVLVSQSWLCAGTDFQPFKLSDGSTITYTSDDPGTTLDSTATFHMK